MEGDTGKITIPKLENGIVVEKSIWILGCDYSKEMVEEYGKDNQY